jgi:hypothetical protein
MCTCKLMSQAQLLCKKSEFVKRDQIGIVFKPIFIFEFWRKI